MPHGTSDGTYRFYASGWDERPHVYVRCENRLGEFWLDPVRLEQSGGFERSEIRRITRILERDEDLLLESWRECFTRDVGAPAVERVAVNDGALSDGRTISVPLRSTGIRGSPMPPPKERDNWDLVGAGEGIHWPDVDEEISVEGFLAGRQSGEDTEVLPTVAQGEARGPTPEAQRTPREDSAQQAR